MCFAAGNVGSTGRESFAAHVKRAVHRELITSAKSLREVSHG